jgi:hypothetical protein
VRKEGEVKDEVEIRGGMYQKEGKMEITWQNIKADTP